MASLSDFVGWNDPIRQIVASRSYVCVGAGSIVAVAKDGSTPPFRVSEGYGAMAVAGDRLYFAELWGSAGSTIKSCPLSACSSGTTTIAAVERYTNIIAVDERNLYGVIADDGVTLGSVWECPLTGCGTSPKMLATHQHASGAGLVLDATHVYWTNRGEMQVIAQNTMFLGGDVSRVPK